MRKLLTTLGTGVAALGMVIGLNAGTAYAAADGPTLCIQGACVWFKHDGDRIYVQDSKADGHSAVAQVCAPSSCSIVANYLWNKQEAGTTLSYGYGTAIPEGTSVYYRPCIGEGGPEDIITCNSGWTHGTA